MNKRKFFGTVLGILFWSVCVVFFTFAYYEWKSDETSIVIGINDLSTKCIPGTDVTVSNIGPVLNYEDGLISEFSIENGMDKEMAIDLRLDITSISDNLLVESFKYAVVTDDGAVAEEGKSNYDYTNPVLEGTFENFIIGSNSITTALVITPSTNQTITQNFQFIVYIDGNMKNDPNMQNNSLVANLMIGNCEENATSMDELQYQAIYSSDDNSLTFIHNKPVTVGETYNDKEVTAVYTGFETAKYNSALAVPWYADGNYANITTVTFEEVVFPISTARWFNEFTNLTSIDLEKLNTSKVTTMLNMFTNCSGLTSLDLSNFDTSSVTNMSDMFKGCRSLTRLNLNSWDTRNVIYMGQMFYECQSLTNLDLSNFNTSNVTTVWYMFYNCKNLISLNVSSFDTRKITSMAGMFQNCEKLTDLDLSNFNTSNVTTMLTMFAGCKNLQKLDLNKFDTSNVTDMSGMFRFCEKLTTEITIKNTSTTYSGIFNGAATAKDTDGNYIGEIIVNYTGYEADIETLSALVDNMVATKSYNSNVVKGEATIV